MSDSEAGVTDSPVAENTQDDFKGLVVESNGEKLDSPKSEVVEEEAPKPEAEQKPKRPGKVERELARERQTNAELMARLEKLEKSQPVKSDKPDEKAPPKPEDFENVLDFIAADRQYAIDEALKNDREKGKQEQTEARRVQEIQRKAESLKEREAKIAEENPTYFEDIAELVGEGLITQPMVDAILDSPVGEKIGLHLTEHPEDAEILSKLRGPQLYKALGILEAHVSGKKEEVQRQTKATAPIVPVKVSANTEADPSKMSQKDFEKWMKA